MIRSHVSSILYLIGARAPSVGPKDSTHVDLHQIGDMRHSMVVCDRNVGKYFPLAMTVAAAISAGRT